jgi:predicted membrane channel-forming protein YqfA (hemolysin III family)
MSEGRDSESQHARLNRELIELLNELRVALAGVAVLFGFLLTVPFSSGFERLDDFGRNLLIVAFFATAAAVVTLVMPTAFHRIRWRRDDKEALLRVSNRMALIGMICLATSISSVVLLFTEVFFREAVAVVVGLVFATIVAVLWFAIPLSRKTKDGDGGATP